MKRPKTLTIDGETYNRSGLSHTCRDGANSGNHSVLFRRASDPAGHPGAFACPNCSYRKTPAQMVAATEAAERAVRAAFGIAR